jgi:CubicO group peptidase (beta-lactamase class C family)
LGGECANAGLFGTADAVLALTEAIRRGGDDVLGTRMWENQLPSVLGRDYALDGDNRFGASLGLRIGELPWMSALGGSFRGHTGFTGTSLQTDRETGLSVVLLTNRVHPTREGDGVHPIRARIAEEAILWARSQNPAA